jgi:hypothetical protein
MKGVGLFAASCLALFGLVLWLAIMSARAPAPPACAYTQDGCRLRAEAAPTPSATTAPQGDPVYRCQVMLLGMELAASAEGRRVKRMGQLEKIRWCQDHADWFGGK